MTDDAESLRLNIQHYQHLLTLYSTKTSREQVLKLLAEAQAQLPHAAAEASDRRR